MSSLKYPQKQLLEDLFQMRGGYVLNFTDRTFCEFFRDYKIEIFDKKYASHGPSGSKANCLRAFWELEPDELVAKVINSLLDLTQQDSCMTYYACLLQARGITSRLLGKPPKIMQEETEEEFLEKEFKDICLSRLNINSDLLKVLEKRLNEVSMCLKGNIPLSCILSIGSILEGLLLDAANKSPSRFNQSTCCPKDKNGKVLIFPDWTLAQLIDVAHDIGLVKLDVKKHSHSVRDFRNYIHPYQQMISNFDPDLHTAKICFQVLKAAIADLAEER